MPNPNGGPSAIPITRNGLVFYLPLWRPDRTGTTFSSMPPNAALCTVTGATWTSQGRSFITDDKITCPTIPALNSATNFTITVWYMRSALATSRVLWALGTTPNRLWAMTAAEVSQLYFYISNGALSTGRFTQLDVVGTFYYFALVFDGAGATNALKAKVYIGTVSSPMTQQTVTFEDAAMPTSTADNSASSFILGSTGTSQYLDGKEGEVLVYSSSLSLAQLEQNRKVTAWRYS